MSGKSVLRVAVGECVGEAATFVCEILVCLEILGHSRKIFWAECASWKLTSRNRLL